MRVTDYFDTKIINVESKLLLSGDYRLNSDFYEALLTSNSFHQTPTFLLEEKARIFHPGITKREYIESKEYGIPFLSTSDLQFYEAADNKYVSVTTSKKLEEYIVKENTILISRSGTIGNVSLVDRNINNCAVTEHAIRIVLNDQNYLGLVYTFLNSEVGQRIIKGQKSGAVIDEIYDEDIAKMQIPDIDTKVVLKLNNLIIDARLKRERAFDLVFQARSLVLQYNNLPPLSSIQPETLDSDGEVEIRMTGLEEFTQDYRLDAHFYNPMAKLIVENIQAYCTNSDNLFNIADCSFRGSRSTRNYVDKENGIAFLSGKNIIQIRPDFKYISKSETANIQEMLLSEGQILISRSGTLGRTLLIHKNYEGCAASEHLIRVKPETSKIDSGYLYAFLSSDYGFHQLLRYKHGAVIDEITEDQISQSLIPLPSEKQQKEIGDLVRQAYELRAEAIRLEDEAQELLTHALTQA
jgi:type I restriction enzyme S subunit